MPHRDLDDIIGKLGKDEHSVPFFCKTLFRKDSSVDGQERADYLDSALKRFERVGGHAVRNKLVEGFGKELINPASTMTEQERQAVFLTIEKRLGNDTPYVQKRAMEALAGAVVHRNVSGLNDEQCDRYIGILKDKVGDKDRFKVGRYACEVMVDLLINGQEVVSDEEEKDCMKRLIDFKFHSSSSKTAGGMAWSFNSLIKEFKKAKKEDRKTHLVESFANVVSEVASTKNKEEFSKLSYVPFVGYEEFSI